ncbi:hypothetical protein [Microseira sp. BLCC-F43]|jgi:hypothetical protein|uniref:hypothetical protein n=1 Tax=Microseira sp. BLCC-F43 TaxID=3153602 RepID=UPI0035B80222
MQQPKIINITASHPEIWELLQPPEQDERGTGRFNSEMYKATRNAILEAGAPVEVAEKAALVIAKDDPGQPNLGRTSDDQSAVTAAWHYLIGGTTND